MKVTIYTINDSESDFCKQAKDFLTAHNIPFENKDVEHDRKALSEMLAVSDNFSGVPVIVIEEEGKDKQVLKGFTQTEFEQALGLTQQPTDNIEPPTMQTEPVVSTPEVVEPEKIDQNSNQVDQQTEQPTSPVAPLEAVQDDKLKGIMDTLAQTSEQPSPNIPPPTEQAPVLSDATPEPAMQQSSNEAISQPTSTWTPPEPTEQSTVNSQSPTSPAMQQSNNAAISQPTSSWTPPAPAPAEQPTANIQPPTSPTMEQSSNDAIPSTPPAAPADLPSIPDFPDKQ